MTSSGLWTPNRDSDPLWKEVPFGTSFGPVLEVQMIIPLRWSHAMDLVVHMRYTPTGNPRVHGMIHRTYTTPLEGGSQEGLR